MSFKNNYQELSDNHKTSVSCEYTSQQSHKLLRRKSPTTCKLNNVKWTNKQRLFGSAWNTNIMTKQELRSVQAQTHFGPAIAPILNKQKNRSDINFDIHINSITYLLEDNKADPLHYNHDFRNTIVGKIIYKPIYDEAFVIQLNKILH